MTRYLFALAMFGVGLPVGAMPPVPRVIAPTVPDKPEEEKPADPTDPAATAERIAKSAKDVGDKLANDDTGTDTRARQEQIKKDIESLIKSMENPPPMGGGGGGSPPPPMAGGSPPPMGGSGQPMPMGGRSGRRQQRDGQQPPPMGGQPMPMGGQPMPMGGQPDKKQGGQPMPMGGEPKPMPMGGETKPMGGKQGGTGPGGGGITTPTLPLEDRIARDFWGNLPDQPRERMMQFFREQYMSRYKDLLPQYYQSLAEKEKKGKK